MFFVGNLVLEKILVWLGGMLVIELADISIRNLHVSIIELLHDITSYVLLFLV